jgi:hypothetical protein
MSVDLDLGFALRNPDPLGVNDVDLSFALRSPPAQVLLDLDLNFELDFNTNQSLMIVKHDGALLVTPMLMKVGDSLIDPVNGEPWTG